MQITEKPLLILRNHVANGNSYTFTLLTYFYNFLSLFGHFVIVNEIIEVAELVKVMSDENVYNGKFSVREITDKMLISLYGDVDIKGTVQLTQICKIKKNNRKFELKTTATWKSYNKMSLGKVIV